MILGSKENIPFFLVQSSDHETPATGLTPAVYLSNNAGPFRSARGAIHETGNGWYYISGGLDANIVGPLLMEIPSVGGADPSSRRLEIMPAAGTVPLVVNSLRYPLTFHMVQSNDHITSATGLSPVVEICKVGGIFESPVGAVSEVGMGWYKLGPNATDVDTPGPLLLKASATGADDVDVEFDVVGLKIIDQIDRVTLTLLATRTILINSGLFTDASCVISLDREPFTLPSVPCCWITPGSINFSEPLMTGGGRFSLQANPQFTVRVIVHRKQDVETHDLSWLTKPSLGGYPIIFEVINALAEQFLYSISGAALTTCGIKAVRILDPYRYANDAMMAVVPLVFTTNVTVDVQTPEPG